MDIIANAVHERFVFACSLLEHHEALNEDITCAGQQDSEDDHDPSAVHGHFQQIHRLSGFFDYCLNRLGSNSCVNLQ